MSPAVIVSAPVSVLFGWISATKQRSLNIQPYCQLSRLRLVRLDLCNETTKPQHSTMLSTLPSPSCSVGSLQRNNEASTFNYVVNSPVSVLFGWISATKQRSLNIQLYCQFSRPRLVRLDLCNETTKPQHSTILSTLPSPSCSAGSLQRNLHSQL